MNPSSIRLSRISLRLVVLAAAMAAPPPAQADDCNTNATTDAAEPTFSDCDTNGTLDACDLTSVQQKLTPSDPFPTNQFGWAVAISGDTLMVAAPYRNADFGPDVGAVYVFRRNGLAWTEVQRIVPTGTSGDARFGTSIALRDEIAVIGAVGDESPANDSGSAFVYRYDGLQWVFEQRLIAADGAAGDQFGKAVAYDGTDIIVGAWQDDDAGTNSGSAYAFQWKGVVDSGSEACASRQLHRMDFRQRDQHSLRQARYRCVSRREWGVKRYIFL